MKNIPFERKVVGLLIIILLFVATTAVLVYGNLNKIINEITEEARPDEKLIIIKEMIYDISDAENSVKSYSLTRDPAYLEDFEAKTSQVDDKIQELRKLSQEDKDHLQYVDSLDRLTKNKFVILEDLLILQDEFRVDEVLKEVLENVENVESSGNSSNKTNPGKSNSKNNKTNPDKTESDNTTNNNSANDKNNNTADNTSAETDEKAGFFERLKEKRRKKKEEKEGNGSDAATDATETITKTETKENIDPGTGTNETVSDNTYSPDDELAKLENKLAKLREKELQNERDLRIKQLLLIQQDKIIMDRIMTIFSKMEEDESRSMKDQIARADGQSNSTKYFVLAFCILVTGLLIFAAYTIFTYVKRNNAYKKALKAAKDETEMRNKEVLDSIHYAQRIQTAILPDYKKIESCIPDSFILYKPKDIVAGDFYWLVKLDKKVLLAVADCTGHGVPGAMVSVVCHNALNRSVREFGLMEPAKILEKTRELVIETLDEGDLKVSDGMDISLCCIDTETRMVQYAGANNPLYMLKNKNLHEIKADKQPVGRYSNARPFTNHVVRLEKGDQLYLFTDGLADQFGGPKGKKFKYKAFKNLLIKTSENTVTNQKDQIDQAFKNWQGGLEQVDDVCVIGVRL